MAYFQDSSTLDPPGPALLDKLAYLQFGANAPLIKTWVSADSGSAISIINNPRSVNQRKRGKVNSWTGRASALTPKWLRVGEDPLATRSAQIMAGVCIIVYTAAIMEGGLNACSERCNDRGGLLPPGRPTFFRLSPITVFPTPLVGRGLTHQFPVCQSTDRRNQNGKLAREANRVGE
ncbi:unnamed protein product [Nezara viridula]|uniref:Uncharacterized protein n=1 Tax=Nezara viridula TaxID=85310 RepID=A0A9P0HLY9_NEZVI|nr:unnamed protein product [Nezara viridula]